MTWLRGLYETYPRRISLLELLLIFGLLVIHRWIVPFWHWGIYRLDIGAPDSLSHLFYSMWLEKNVVRAILVVSLLCIVVSSNVIRNFWWKELGIRFDNIWKSARECLIVLCVILAVAAVIVLALPEKFSFDRYFDDRYGHSHFIMDISFGALSGIAQQFLLQSFFLVRALQIFKRKSLAILTSSVIFSLLHTPNLKLMFLTLVFGALCSVLFIRNRNIFTLGIMHGVVQQVLRVLFAAFLVSGVSYYDRGYYDYSLKVGPYRGEPEFVAYVDYDKNNIKETDSGLLSIPVSITNGSTWTWDSDDKDYPVYISYHLLDSKGDVVSWDNMMTPFSKPIRPGESATVDLKVSTPPPGGTYYAEVDILRQQVSGSKVTTWFKYKGSKTTLIPLPAR